VKAVADKPANVLCVDAATLLGDALAKLFSLPGYSLDRACDGNDAWAKLAPDLPRYDVLFVDHDLPTLTALQLVGRARDAGYQGRVIVFGRMLSEDDIELYREMGVEAIVADEVDAKRLLGVVKAFHRQE
jgi:DNA-binding response OmpR family regulator